MAVKLGELVKQVENTGIRLVGGKGGLSNPVEWVHIVGNMETAGFLKGGEIVFTTGIGMEEETSLLMLTEKIYHNNASGLIPLPDTITTINTTTNVSIILTNALVTVDIGRTSLGKYIFLTISFSFNILAAPSVTLDEKNIQGTSATKRNR